MEEIGKNSVEGTDTENVSNSADWFVSQTTYMYPQTPFLSFFFFFSITHYAESPLLTTFPNGENIHTHTRRPSEAHTNRGLIYGTLRNITVTLRETYRTILTVATKPHAHFWEKERWTTKEHIFGETHLGGLKTVATNQDSDTHKETTKRSTFGGKHIFIHG